MYYTPIARVHVVSRPSAEIADPDFFFLDTGWQSLMTILEELKGRPIKRGSAASDLENFLAKRVKSVSLGEG